MPKNKKESDYYPNVERWLKRHFSCFASGINKGLKYSRIDVVGVRDVGGDLSGDIEVIAIEVKRGTQAFATACGQTYGYRVYANRVYLADIRPKAFSFEELQIANQIGIGLIQIKEQNIIEVQSSPIYSPYKNYSFRLLETLKLGYCQICGTFFKIGDTWRFNKVIREDLKQAVKKDKGLIFWNRELSERKKKLGLRESKTDYTLERRFICPDCVYYLLADIARFEEE